MSLKVLNEDWNDYDSRKIRDRRDTRFFALTENWELDYLIRKYKKAHPYLSEAAIPTTKKTDKRCLPVSIRSSAMRISLLIIRH
jgi:hypothetical protein